MYAIRSYYGHPLLASDEFSRSIDICEELLDADVEGEAQYEARLRLPLALLRRASCWVNAGDVAHSADARVITSYSIHYTKLYEVPKNSKSSPCGMTRNSFIPRRKASISGIRNENVFVITSYSIHYTKLYELGPAADLFHLPREAPFDLFYFV